MKMTHWLASAIGAAALGFAVLPAQAAPVSALTDNAVAAQEAGALGVDQVRYRCRGYWRHGHWHCYRNYSSYGYYGYDYSPGVSIYLGGRGHRRHR